MLISRELSLYKHYSCERFCLLTWATLQILRCTINCTNKPLIRYRHFLIFLTHPWISNHLIVKQLFRRLAWCWLFVRMAFETFFTKLCFFCSAASTVMLPMSTWTWNQECHMQSHQKQTKNDLWSLVSSVIRNSVCWWECRKMGFMDLFNFSIFVFCEWGHLKFSNWCEKALKRTIC